MRTVWNMLLAMALCGGVAHAVPDTSKQSTGAESKLAACKESRGRDGIVELACPEVRLRIGADLPSDGVAPYFESVIEMFRKQDVVATEQELLVAGVKRRGLRAKTLETTNVLTFLPTALPTRLRMVMCASTGDADTLCLPFLEALSVRFARAGAESAASTEPPQVAGRTVTTPEGCSFSEKSGRRVLRCGGTSLGWSEMPASIPFDLQTITLALKKQLAQQGEVRESTYACTIEDKPTQCRDYRVAVHGTTIRTVIGVAVLRETHVAVSCTMNDAANAPPAPPCDVVMSWTSKPSARDTMQRDGRVK